MATYVQRSSELAFAFPYRFEQATAQCFVVPASPVKLKELCDRYLNEPSGNALRCVPATPSLLFSFIHYPFATPTLPEEPRASFSYNELAIWMLVADLAGPARTGSLKPMDALHWFLPAVYVDDPYAMIAGREIYGFPKALAKVTIPPVPGSLAVDVPALTTAGGSGPRNRRLVEVEPMFDSEAEDEKSWAAHGSRLGKLFRADEDAQVHGLLGALEGMVSAVKDLPFLDLFGKATVVCLKQFRDGADASAASYQRVVEMSPKIKNLKGKPLPPYKVRVSELDHDRLRADLGIVGGEAAAFTMQFDMELGAATDIA